MDGNIDLGRARRDAKALLRAARAGSAQASTRLRSAGLRADRPPCLADAQAAVARELGLASWPELLRAVEAQGRTPLIAAAMAGDARTVASLLAGGADPDARNPATGRAALHEAATAGDGRATYLLLDGGADPNVRDRTGGTPLHDAAARGELDVVSVLVTWVPVDCRAMDGSGRNALELCLEASAGATDPAEVGEHLAVAKVLMSNGLTACTDSVSAAAPRVRDWVDRATGAPSSVPDVNESIDEIAPAMDEAWYVLLARTGNTFRDVGDGFAVRTGVFDNTWNGVVCSRLPDDEMESEVADVLTFLRAVEAPARWLVRPGAGTDRLRDHLVRLGAEAERSAVYMRARLEDLTARVAPRSPVTISRAHTIEDLVRAGTAHDSFGGDAEQQTLAARVDVQTFRREPLAFRRWMAVVGDRCVGMATVHVHGATAELRELEVVPSERRHGVGRALTLHAFADARANGGCTTGILSPTSATVPFYDALGFSLRQVPPDRSYYLPSP